MVNLKLNRKWYKTWWIWAIIVFTVVSIGYFFPSEKDKVIEDDIKVVETSTAADVDVPNVIGMKANQANKTLKNIRLLVNISSDDGSVVVLKSNWIVKSQSPEAGAKAKSGDTVKLIVYKIESDSSSSSEKSAKNSNGNNSTEERYTMPRNVAEQYCQDAGMLGRYIDLNSTSIINALNYNDYFSDKAGGYDKNGNPIAFFQWNGKNKSTGKVVGFSCWISGSDKDHIELHWLSIDGVDFVGSVEFESYDENGSLLQ